MSRGLFRATPPALSGNDDASRMVEPPGRDSGRAPDASHGGANSEPENDWKRTGPRPRTGEPRSIRPSRRDFHLSSREARVVCLYERGGRRVISGHSSVAAGTGVPGAGAPGTGSVNSSSKSPGTKAAAGGCCGIGLCCASSRWSTPREGCRPSLSCRSFAGSFDPEALVMLDRGRESRLSRLPLPPNRTCGSPAYGSPVSGLTYERTGRPGHGLSGESRAPARQRSDWLLSLLVRGSPACDPSRPRVLPTSSGGGCLRLA